MTQEADYVNVELCNCEKTWGLYREMSSTRSVFVGFILFQRLWWITGFYESRYEIVVFLIRTLQCVYVRDVTLSEGRMKN